MNKLYFQLRPAKRSFFSFFGLLYLLFLLLSTSSLQAQSTTSIVPGTETVGGLNWKDQGTIMQIVQQELSATNNSLAQPNITDWSTAMLEAYRSLLSYTQLEIQVNHDMPSAIEKAFVQMRTEVVSYPAARAMVMDDMQAQKIELIQKLTNQ